MKILFVSGIFPPDGGGPATYVTNMAKVMKDRGHEVHVLTMGEFENRKGVTYISRKINYFIRSYKIKKFIESHDWDVVYAQDPFSVGFGVALAKTNAKKILKVVGDNVWEISRDILGVKDLINEFQDIRYSPRIELMRKIEHWTARQFPQVVTPSNYLKGLVSSWGVDPKKIRVIFNAVNVKASKYKNRSATRKKLRITGKTYIFVGRFAPWKGLEVLIDVVKKRNENLILVGDGMMDEKLRERAGDYKGIKFTGRLPNAQALEYVFASDVFVLNSGYEGLPHVIVEAFNLGTPCIISSECGNPEIVQDGYNGLLFKFDNANSLDKAMSKLNAKNMKKFAANAKKSLPKFSMEQMIENTVDVITN